MANIEKFQEQANANVNIIVYKEKSCTTLRHGLTYNDIIMFYLL